jgi:hypothetical protein
MGAEHEVLLYHTEVRWLSRGRVLKRLVELRAQVLVFLREHNNDLYLKFECHDFALSMAYLADIFDHINQITLSLQGRDVIVVDAVEKLQAFMSLLAVWKRRVEKDNCANFPCVEQVLAQGETSATVSLPPSLKKSICDHLETLQTAFDNYFMLDDNNFDPWIRNPFRVDLNRIDDKDLAKDELIDLRTKQVLQMEFDTKTLPEFWCTLAAAYPLLAKRAMAVLIPFVTTYLCESGFSTLVAIKTKNRNRLNACDDMRVALSKTAPQFRALVDSKQQQRSH